MNINKGESRINLHDSPIVLASHSTLTTQAI